jgi:hypothetical protein
VGRFRKTLPSTFVENGDNVYRRRERTGVLAVRRWVRNAGGISQDLAWYVTNTWSYVPTRCTVSVRDRIFYQTILVCLLFYRAFSAEKLLATKVRKYYQT